MKQRRIFEITLLSLIMALAAPFLLWAQQRGNEEDPNERAYYEWLRLHDPASGQIPPNIRARELEFAATLPTVEALAAASLRKGGVAKTAQLANWMSRGPYNVGGRTRALGVDVSNANTILAGGVSGGMWRSTDGGGVWAKTTLASDLHSVTCLAQDTRTGKTGTWYYGTGEYRGNSADGGSAPYRGDGIFRSTNGGANWTRLSSTVSGTPQTIDQFDYVWNIVTDPSNSAQDEVYAATYTSIMRSVDGGTSWTTALGSSTNSAGYTDVAITPTGVLYATFSSFGTTKGIWRSTDGTNWANITPAGWPASYRRIAIGIAPSNQNAVYFLADTIGAQVSTTRNPDGHAFWKYTYLSGNGAGSGGAWLNRSANIPSGFVSYASYCLIVKVKPDNENAVFIGGLSLYRSTDGFATNTNTTTLGGLHVDNHAIVFSPTSAATMFVGNDGGVYRTTNNLATSVTWTALNTGYLTSQFYTVAVDHATNGNNIIIGGTQDNGTWFTNTTNAATPWTSIFGGDGAYCAVADRRASYYVSYQNGVVYRLLLNDNGGASGSTRVDPTRANNAASYLFINPFALDPNDTRMMYLAGGDRLWRNSDLTAIPLASNNTTTVNWTELTNTAVASGQVTALGVSRVPANRLYYGTSNGRVFRLEGANSGNPSPVDVWTGKGFPASAYVSCIAVDPANADRVLAVFSNYSVVSLFYTTDAGASWTAVAGNLEQNPDGTGTGPSTRWAAILSQCGATAYFVGTSTGLYSATNLNGASTVWAQEGASAIGNVVVDMLDARESDGLVVAGTHGRGIFSANLPVSGNVDIALVIDRSGSMGQSGFMEPAKTAASTFVGFMQTGDRAAVVSFSGGATVNFPLTAITSDATKTSAQNAISTIISNGGTSIGAGMQSGQSELNKGNTQVHQGMVLLSDGIENTAPYVAGVLSTIPTNTDIYTIALGSNSDQAMLNNIAQQTGGVYYFAPDANQLLSIYNQIRSNVIRQQVFFTFSGSVGQGATQLAYALVDALTCLATFSITFQGGDVDLELVTPSGVVINPGSVTSNPNVTFNEGPTYDFYTIKAPEAGQWTLRIIGANVSGTQAYSGSLQGASLLTMDAFLDKTEYITGQPILVRAKLLVNAQPIAGATVAAEVQVPTTSHAKYRAMMAQRYPPAQEEASAAPISPSRFTTLGEGHAIAANEPLVMSYAGVPLTLFDDGTHGDGAANDGVYGNYFANTAKDGSYTFTVKASGAASPGGQFHRESTFSTFVKPGTAVSVISISPNRGQVGQTLNVTVNGSNFVNGAALAFSGSGISVNSVSFVNATQLTANLAIAPNALEGPRDVIVTNPNGQSGTGPGLFEVVACGLTTFVDNFDSGTDNWLLKTPTRWGINVFNGNPAFCLGGPLSVSDEFAVLRGEPWLDFDLTLKAKSDAGSNHNYFVLFDVPDAVNANMNGYYLQFATGGVRLYRTIGNKGAEIAFAPGDYVSDTDFHEINVARRSPNIKISVDGLALLDLDDATFKVGSIGFGSFNSEACFDDVRLTGARSQSDHFVETFEDGNANGWTPLNPSRWQITTDGGSLSYFLNTTTYESPDGIRMGEISLLNDSTYSDFILECQARSVDAGANREAADLCLAFGYQDIDSYYYVNFNSGAGLTQLHRIDNGAGTPLATYTQSTFADGNYHSLRIERSGSQISVFFDDRELFVVNNSYFGPGKIGVGSYNDSGFFDNIHVSRGTCSLTTPAVTKIVIPKELKVPVGGKLDVPIIVSTPSVVGFAQFTVEYDGNDLQFDNATVGGDALGFAVAQQNANLPFPPTTPGTTRNVLVQISGGGANTFTGQDKTVAVLHFTAIGSAGAFTPLASDTDCGHTFLTTAALQDICGGQVIFVNGDATITNPISISGTVRYYSAARPIPNATISLTGAATATTTTNPNGFYAFSNVAAGSYTWTPSKTGDVRGAIRGSDVLKILQALAFLSTLNPDERIAADVDGNGSVTGADAVAMLRYLAFLSSGTANAGQWKFSPSNYSLTINGAVTGDFKAYLLGDVNGDWTPTTPLALATTPPQLVIGPARWRENELRVPLRVPENAVRVYSVVASLDWEVPAAVEFRFEPARDEVYAAINTLEKNKTHLALVRLNGFAPGELIGELIGSVSEPGAATSPQNGVLGQVTALQVNDVELAGDLIRDAAVTLPASFALYSNYPNPFNAQTAIRFAIPAGEEKTEVRLEIYSIYGQLVRQVYRGAAQPGYHTQAWDGRDDHGKPVSSGVYIYRLRAGEFVANKRLLLLK